MDKLKITSKQMTGGNKGSLRSLQRKESEGIVTH